MNTLNTTQSIIKSSKKVVTSISPPTDYVIYYPLTSFNAENQLFNVATGTFVGTLTNPASPAIGASIDTTIKNFGTSSLKYSNVGTRYQISNFNNTETKFTISVWFYATNTSDKYIFSAYGGNTATDLIQIFLTQGKLTLVITNGGYNSDNQQIADVTINTWYHLAWVVNGTNWSVYLNNILYSKTSMRTLPIKSRTSFIGATGSFSLLGNIQDFRVYNRDLTSTEVTNIYNFRG